MTCKLLLSCDGCHIEATSEKWITSRFRSFDGKGWGFGVWETDTIEDIKPDGWIVHDPLTACTYCPECWAEINADGDATEAQDASAGA